MSSSCTTRDFTTTSHHRSNETVRPASKPSTVGSLAVSMVKCEVEQHLGWMCLLQGSHEAGLFNTFVVAAVRTIPGDDIALGSPHGSIVTLLVRTGISSPRIPMS